MRDLALTIFGIPFAILRILLFAICAIPFLIAGLELPRKRFQERTERPVIRAEDGTEDDDDDPNRRNWKQDRRDHENIAMAMKALKKSSYEPEIPTQVWLQQRRVRPG